MISVIDQIDSGILVCPETKARLHRKGNTLVSEAGTTYRLTETHVPILLKDAPQAEKYAAGSVQMTNEYTRRSLASLVNRLKAAVRKDYRTKSSRDALSQVLEAASDGHLCLSVGGGPLRINPGVTNLNISCFPNVDVVADAHVLPYVDSTVDSIYCEAVLEHLLDPSAAVAEMFRVLKPGGKVIAITPFLQRFHGYPYHFQNFTLIGHSLIFQRAGFEVLESGTCVGPTYAIVNLVSAYFTQCLPRFLGLPLAAAWNLAGICLLPLDLVLNRPASSHVLASTTYVLAEKPGCQTRTDNYCSK
jgi:SAM-dependent methyltransferase